MSLLAALANPDSYVNPNGAQRSSDSMVAREFDNRTSLIVDPPDVASARHQSRDRDVWVDLWRMPADGGEPTKVTSSDAVCTAPSWSADGTTLAFLRRAQPAGTNSLLHCIAAGGGVARAVDSDFDRHSSIDPVRRRYPIPRDGCWTAASSTLLKIAATSA